MTTVNYVDAKFGGKPVRFRLAPKSIGFFEEMYGSARHILTRLLADQWKASDVINVLTWSNPDGLGAGQAVERVVSARPAVYAPLAITVLVAALSGINADDANFDEDAE